MLDKFLGPWDKGTNKRDLTKKGLPNNKAANWDGNMGASALRNNYDTSSSFFYNTNNVCYNSFGDLPKPIKVTHAESNNYGELLMKSFASTSNAEKKEAEYLQRYFYEFFVIQIGPAPFRGTGASIKKKQQILLQTEWPIEFLHVVYLMRITRLIAITQKKELLYL